MNKPRVVQELFFDESSYGPEYLYLMEVDGFERWLEQRFPEAGTMAATRRVSEEYVLERVQELRKQADALQEMVDWL